MNRFARVALLALLALPVSGCGDSATEPEGYADISGHYAGVMAGISQGIALDADFSLTITQDRGTLSGSWSLSGVLTDGLDAVALLGTGVLTGSIDAGHNPSVNMALQSGACPNWTGHYSGTFDSANRRLTMSGPVDVLGDACEVLLSYPMNMVLER